MSASAQRVCRLAQEAAEADDALSALKTLVELRRELEVLTREEVARGVGAGRSFGEVARVMGISRQAAHRRYRELAPASLPDLIATEQARRAAFFGSRARRHDRRGRPRWAVSMC